MVEPATISLLIIDDHALFRGGLRLILENAFEGAQVLEAASVEAALDADTGQAPSVVLLDIRLNGLSGLESISLLQRRWPGVPVIMISSDAGSHTIRRARERGAAGFVSKAEGSPHIIQAIETALRQQHGDAALPHPPAPPAARLTARQCEVLHFLDQGLSNKSIARRLDLSENTVRWHVQSILSLLGATSRAQAVYKARLAGLIA